MKYVRWGRTTCPSGADIVYKGKELASGSNILICNAGYIRKGKKTSFYLDPRNGRCLTFNPPSEPLITQ